jgi:hypothetical protein
MNQITNDEARAAPPATLMPLIKGFMASRMLYVAAELAIADRMSQGPKSSDELAAETGVHASSLHTMMRALASFGVFEETDKGGFALTALGRQLCAEAPGSLRNIVLMFGSPRAWRCTGEMAGSIRTGEPMMRLIFGMSGFEYLATHPDEARIFNEAMAEITRHVARAVTAAYDFSKSKVIADIGGGNGTLVSAILAAFPHCRGVVFDLPAGVAEAPTLLAAAGLADRCEVVAGDFFQSVPVGADMYILKSVIHNWDDERSTAILKNCPRALGSEGELLLIERVLPAKMSDSPVNRAAAVLDMRMLTMAGGRERTESEYAALLAASGFSRPRILPLPQAAGISLVHALPI